MTGVAPGSQLRRLARREVVTATEAVERCDLCATPLPPDHRHLLDLDSGDPLCACRACKVLFDRGEAGGDHYRLIPERRVSLDRFQLDDRMWAALGVPVALAFFNHSTRAGQVIARYPSAVGLTTSVPAADAWGELAAANPVLAEMEPDVEALLVNRVRGAREQWIAPIDDCFRLAAHVRRHWKGFSGGDEVWTQIAAFFDELRNREEARWPG